MKDKIKSAIPWIIALLAILTALTSPFPTQTSSTIHLQPGDTIQIICQAAPTAIPEPTSTPTATPTPTNTPVPPTLTPTPTSPPSTATSTPEVVLGVYYVATDGDDSNPGTEAQPFRTIAQGIGVLDAGDTLYIREGVYRERVRISTSGTADKPITISAYPGERPVADGRGLGGHVFYISGSHIVLDGLEIRNAGERGVAAGGHDNQMLNLNVHHCYKSGILVSGQRNLVEGCTVWQNSQRYHTDGRTSGCLCATESTDAVFRGNAVYNNWGEAMSAFKARNTIVEDNIIYDNFAVNLYIDNAPGTVVRRNLIYSTGSGWNRAPGIHICDENYSSGSAAQSTGLMIVNNLVLGCNGGLYFRYESQSKGLKDSLIAYNTFANAETKALLVIRDAHHENTRIVNNTFLQEGSLPVATVGDSSGGLSFSHNLWSKTPPVIVSGDGDVVGDPLLAKTGPTGPGLLTPEWFKILAASPAKDRARIINEATEDFFRNTRGNDPDMGAHEL